MTARLLEGQAARTIPLGCSCTWTLRLGAGEATWTPKGEPSPACRTHGDGSDEKGLVPVAAEAVPG